MPFNQLDGRDVYPSVRNHAQCEVGRANVVGHGFPPADIDRPLKAWPVGGNGRAPVPSLRPGPAALISVKSLADRGGGLFQWGSGLTSPATLSRHRGRIACSQGIEGREQIRAAASWASDGGGCTDGLLANAATANFRRGPGGKAGGP